MIEHDESILCRYARDDNDDDNDDDYDNDF